MLIEILISFIFQSPQSNGRIQSSIAGLPFKKLCGSAVTKQTDRIRVGYDYNSSRYPKKEKFIKKGQLPARSEWLSNSGMCEYATTFWYNIQLY